MKKQVLSAAMAAAVIALAAVSPAFAATKKTSRLHKTRLTAQADANGDQTMGADINGGTMLGKPPITGAHHGKKVTAPAATSAAQKAYLAALMKARNDYQAALKAARAAFDAAKKAAQDQYKASTGTADVPPTTP